MKVTRTLPLAAVASIAVLATACGVTPATNLSLGSRANLSAAAAPGELLVKFRAGATAAKLSSLGLRALGTSAGLSRLGWSRVGFDAGKTNMATVLSQLGNDSSVLYAEPNYIARVIPVSTKIVRPQDDPAVKYDDPMAGKQYTLDKIALPAAHAITMGSTKTTLSVVDTGVDYAHPDFKAADGKSRVIKGKDFANNDDDPNDKYGHGTHCAGIAAASANNKEGIVGVAPGVNILAVKVLGDNGSGTYAGVAAGISYSADQGAKVISMSLGGPSSSKVLEDAVKYAIAKDSLIVAAMGNDYDNVKSYPAAIPGVMAVISTDSRDEKSDFSNYGDWASVSAPGSDILSTLPTFSNVIGQKDYGELSGTSMATPAVAGLAALVRDLHPDWDAKTVRAKIEQTSDDLGDKGFDINFGHGRVNALKALR
ncbi:MAG: S8 family serine peptidase [Candidatus Sericytochromatia bacterium]|nr:S8 family serine peptidase [Candidatus Tanganyikabacteria bacterium]